MIVFKSHQPDQDIEIYFDAAGCLRIVVANDLGQSIDYRIDEEDVEDLKKFLEDNG